jgi:hypothetical protein
MKKYNKLAARGKKVLPFNSNTLVLASDITAAIPSPLPACVPKGRAEPKARFAQTGGGPQNKVKVGVASIATLKGAVSRIPSFSSRPHIPGGPEGREGAVAAIGNLNTSPSNKQHYSIDPLYLDKGGYIKEGCNSFAEQLNFNNRRKYLKGFLGQGHSPALNSNVILHQNTKAVVYSFNKVNNLSPLLTKTEYLLKSVFRSIFSLISRPIYLIKHDKVIIRLFLYLSPKIDKYLDTSTIGTRAKNSAELPTGDVIGTSNFNIGRSVAGFSANINRFKIGKFLKFKSLRPNVIDILKYQIQHCGKQESSSLIAEAREGISILENKCFNNLRGAVALAIPPFAQQAQSGSGQQNKGPLEQGWAPQGEDGKAFGRTLP